MAGPFYDPVTGEIFDDGPEAAGPEPGVAGDGLPTQPPAAETGRRGFTPLTASEAADLLHREHRVSVSADDPLLMLVTLHGRCLADLQQVLAFHDTAIEAAITATAGSTVRAVNEALETLKDKTVRAGLSNAMALVERQGMAMEAFQGTTRRHLRVMAALTASSWLVCLLALAVLWSGLK
ncbi:hypothetical protein [Insolitispirillum peregrinum]|uniref:Transcriptional activator TraM n=1 Tax=Insolitispirillum peregrinum TaxID=80876 RepID=A0A1N7MHN9_9PROT|nr:hypothetical protein [Insolitispirillum peregrinum]SIS85592.1 hypothetical protein SAMN05421779_104128 [Insolitispirillum peregrinum]